MTGLDQFSALNLVFVLFIRLEILIPWTLTQLLTSIQTGLH